MSERQSGRLLWLTTCVFEHQTTLRQYSAACGVDWTLVSLRLNYALSERMVTLYAPCLSPVLTGQKPDVLSRKAKGTKSFLGRGGSSYPGWLPPGSGHTSCSRSR